MFAAMRLAVPELPDLLRRRDLTIDDVAHLPEDLLYELIDGRLVLTPSPSFVHQTLVLDIGHACKINRPPGIGVSADQSVMIDSHNERRPDVVGIRLEGATFNPIGAFDLILAVEVVSPSSRRTDHEEKLKVYADAAVPYYWIIDPLADRVTMTEYVLGADALYQQGVHTSDRVTLERPWQITLDLPAWTADRDEARRARRIM